MPVLSLGGHLPASLSIPKCMSLISVITGAVRQCGGAALAGWQPFSAPQPRRDIFLPLKALLEEEKKKKEKLLHPPHLNGRTIFATSIFSITGQIWKCKSSPVLCGQKRFLSSHLTTDGGQEG